MNWKRRVVIGIAMFILVSAIAIGVALLLHVKDRQAATAYPQVTNITHESTSVDKEASHVKPDGNIPKEFTQKNADFLEDALNSGTKDGQAKALASQMRKGNWEASGVLPDGAVLKIDRQSFKTSSDNMASVDATVSGSVNANFILLLIKEEGQWLVYTTTQQK